MKVAFHHDEEHTQGILWSAWHGKQRLGSFLSNRNRPASTGWFHAKDGELVRVERYLKDWKKAVQTEWERGQDDHKN